MEHEIKGNDDNVTITIVCPPGVATDMIYPPVGPKDNEIGQPINGRARSPLGKTLPEIVEASDFGISLQANNSCIG